MNFNELRSCITHNDWIIIFVNVIFFVVVQTLFFRFIASKQYENVLKQKVEILKIYADKFPSEKKRIHKLIEKYLKENNELINQQYKTRNQKNLALEDLYCWNFLKVIVALLVITMFLNKQPWNPVYTLGLIFVVLGYTTEILFFFLIVKRYEFVGDHHISSELSKHLFEIPPL